MPYTRADADRRSYSCTSEGLKAVIYLQSLPCALLPWKPIRSCAHSPHCSNMPQLVSRARMCDAVDIILSLQNADGGFAACELARASKLLELLNPAEVFRDIMIEYTYPECTTACESVPRGEESCSLTSTEGLTALSVFKKLHPDYRHEDIEFALAPSCASGASLILPLAGAPRSGRSASFTPHNAPTVAGTAAGPSALPVRRVSFSDRQSVR